MHDKKRGGESPHGGLSENWKTVVAQGAASLALGVVIVAVPELTARVVSILLGAFLLVYALISLLAARSARSESLPSAWLIVRGVIAAAGGLVVLFWPGLKALTLLYILAVFAIAVGVLIGALGLIQGWKRGYKAIAGVGGLLSVLYGVIVISRASDLTGSFVWMTGPYAIALGMWLMVLGLGARSIQRRLQAGRT